MMKKRVSKEKLINERKKEIELLHVRARIC